MRFYLSLVLALFLTMPAASALAHDNGSKEATEQRLSEIIAEDGVHVVHFWAPWCSNSIAELREGWFEVIEEHPAISFTFVTIWNDGESGRDMLDRFAVPQNVEEILQADTGPSDIRENRHREFLGMPVTWIPTTWIFRNNGELAFAFNFGEMEMDDLRKFIAFSKKDWSND